MLIIDRFEEGYAVVEDSDTDKIFSLNRELIEDGAREGDVIALTDGVYRVDSEETKRRRAEALALLNRLNIKSE